MLQYENTFILQTFESSFYLIIEILYQSLESNYHIFGVVYNPGNYFSSFSSSSLSSFYYSSESESYMNNYWIHYCSSDARVLFTRPYPLVQNSHLFCIISHWNMTWKLADLSWGFYNLSWASDAFIYKIKTCSNILLKIFV